MAKFDVFRTPDGMLIRRSRIGLIKMRIKIFLIVGVLSLGSTWALIFTLRELTDRNYLFIYFASFLIWSFIFSSNFFEKGINIKKAGSKYSINNNFFFDLKDVEFIIFEMYVSAEVIGDSGIVKLKLNKSVITIFRYVSSSEAENIIQNLISFLELDDLAVKKIVR